MPLYEYVCPECGARFDRLVRSSSNADEATCPTCGSPTATRVFSTFATTAAGKGSAQTSPGCGPVG